MCFHVTGVLNCDYLVNRHSRVLNLLSAKNKRLSLIASIRPMLILFLNIDNNFKNNLFNIIYQQNSKNYESAI